MRILLLSSTTLSLESCENIHIKHFLIDFGNYFATNIYRRTHHNLVPQQIMTDLQVQAQVPVQAQVRNTITIQHMTMSIETIVDKVNSNFFNLSPPYQRSFVWNKQKKVALVESLLENFSVGNVILSQCSLVCCNVIDGKQRISTLAYFLNNEFKVTVNERAVLFRDMTEREQAIFCAKQIPITMCTGMTLEDESNQFDRINRSAPLMGGEKIRAYLDSPFLGTVELFFCPTNPTYMKLCGCIGEFDKGRHNRFEKDLVKCGYIAGACKGPSYINTSFPSIEPLLKLDKTQWNVEMVQKARCTMEDLTDIWDTIINVHMVQLRKEWSVGSRIWQIGFLNGYILASLHYGSPYEEVKDTWCKFIKEASETDHYLDKWRQLFSDGSHTLNRKRLRHGWECVKRMLHDSYDSEEETVAARVQRKRKAY